MSNTSKDTDNKHNESPEEIFPASDPVAPLAPAVKDGDPGQADTTKSNEHGDRVKKDQVENWSNDEGALRKHHDNPDDSKQSPVDPERDYSDPSGQRD